MKNHSYNERYFRMQQRAFEIANKWINRNYALYQKDHKMWEKYDVAKEYVRAAKGGEYENQVR